MSSHWTAQDVERFREQQRWRLRHKANQQQQQFKRCQAMPSPSAYEPENSDNRTRKVSLKFRREHQQFLSKQQMPAHLSALAVTLRPAFAVPRQRHHIESPLPHTDHVMFNAFDSTASPEAFSLEPESNQEEDERHERRVMDWASKRKSLQFSGTDDDADMVMVSDGEDEAMNSLWRRRFQVQGMEKRPPKLGRVALWEAADEEPSYCYMPFDNQATELRRMKLPFDDSSM